MGFHPCVPEDSLFLDQKIQQDFISEPKFHILPKTKDPLRRLTSFRVGRDICSSAPQLSCCMVAQYNTTTLLSTWWSDSVKSGFLHSWTDPSLDNKITLDPYHILHDGLLPCQNCKLLWFVCSVIVCLDCFYPSIKLNKIHSYFFFLMSV